MDHGLSQKAIDGATFQTIGVTKGTACQLHAVQGYCDRPKYTKSLMMFVLLTPNQQNWCRSSSCTLLQPVSHKCGHSGQGSGTLLLIFDTQEEGEARDVRCNNNCIGKLLELRNPYQSPLLTPARPGGSCRVGHLLPAS